MTKNAVANQDTTDVTTSDIVERRTIDIFKEQVAKALPTITQLLPAHLTAEKFQAQVVVTVSYNPKLLECTPMSLLRSVMEMAEIGLSTNPQMKESDILPVWNNKLKKNEAQGRPRARGLMKLCRQSGEIIDIEAHEVYAADHFEYEYGLNKRLEHVPTREENRGPITFGYCIWTTKEGIKGFEVIDRIRIDRSRDASENYKAFKKGSLPAQFVPWIKDEGEMVRKTAVIAASKYMPQSTENTALMKAIAMQERDHKSLDALDALATDAPSLPAPPRPTRSEPTRAAVDTMRKEQVAQDQAYRQTMAEDSRAQPSHDATTGEVLEPGDDGADETDARQDAPQPQEKTKASAPANTEHVAVENLLRKKLETVKGTTMFKSSLDDYGPELDLMRSEDEPRYKKLMADIYAKHPSLKG